MKVNFIAIFDNTSGCNYIYVSESVTDILGYLPEEMVGRSAFDFAHSDEQQALHAIHVANVYTERMSSVTTYQVQHKDGHYVTCDIVIHFCYDSMVATCFELDSDNDMQHKMRASSADEVYVIQDGAIRLQGVWNDSQKRMKGLLTSSKYPWKEDSQVNSCKEPRFCLIINRYTSQSSIVFATPISKELVGLDQELCVGHSLYDYVADKDRENVEKSIKLAKSTNMIVRIRFEWTSPNLDKPIPIEAVTSCSYDGLVFVARRRTPAILAHGANE